VIEIDHIRFVAEAVVTASLINSCREQGVPAEELGLCRDDIVEAVSRVVDEHVQFLEDFLSSADGLIKNGVPASAVFGLGCSPFAKYGKEAAEEIINRRDL
jgi:hypothetical protein